MKRKLLHARGKRAGLHPGSLVAHEDAGSFSLRSVVYNAERCVEEDATMFFQPGFDPARPFADGGAGVRWVEVCGARHGEQLQKLGDVFGIHALTLEDILTSYSRPKVEVFDNYLAVFVAAPVSGEPGSERQAALILGRNFVLSFHEDEDPISGCLPIFHRIRNADGRIRTKGADYLVCALLDYLTDRYFDSLENIEKELEALEDHIEAAAAQAGALNVAALHQAKRRIALLRKVVRPMREMTRTLIGVFRDPPPELSDFLDGRNVIYLRNIEDHSVEITETIEHFRDELTGLYELHFARENLRLNEIIKFLTVMSSVFIPLTFAVGIYGMNFRHMPELAWTYAYPVFLGGMGAVGLGMLLWLRHRSWL